MGAEGAFCAEPEGWSASAERRSRLSTWFRVSMSGIFMQHSRSHSYIIDPSADLAYATSTAVMPSGTLLWSSTHTTLQLAVLDWDSLDVLF